MVFDQEIPPPARREITKEGTSTAQPCDGMHCLVGSRRFEPSSQWYIPPLLDAVPNVPGMAQERVSFDRGVGRGGVNGDVDANESRPSGGDVGSDQWTYMNAALGKWAALCGVTILLVVLSKLFLDKRKAHVLVAPKLSSNEDATTTEITKPSLPEAIQSHPAVSPPDLPVINLAASQEASLIPQSPNPESRASYLPTPPLDTVEPEDADDSEKEGVLDTPRRRGPRRRKRGKKKKNEVLSPEVDAEVDEGPLKEMKGHADEVAVQIVTPTSPISIPPTSSLLVSDTVLGKYL